jgi:hypothetical protein
MTRTRRRRDRKQKGYADSTLSRTGVFLDVKQRTSVDDDDRRVGDLPTQPDLNCELARGCVRPATLCCRKMFMTVVWIDGQKFAEFDIYSSVRSGHSELPRSESRSELELSPHMRRTYGGESKSKKEYADSTLS